MRTSAPSRAKARAAAPDAAVGPGDQGRHAGEFARALVGLLAVVGVRRHLLLGPGVGLLLVGEGRLVALVPEVALRGGLVGHGLLRSLPVWRIVDGSK